MTYEYIRIEFDFGDLAELNRLASVGWRTVAVCTYECGTYALLERELLAVDHCPDCGFPEWRGEPRTRPSWCENKWHKLTTGAPNR